MNILCKPDIDADPRVGRLPPHLYKLFSGLVRQAALTTDGTPWGVIAAMPLEHLAWEMHTYSHVLRRALPKLEALGLVEALENGSRIIALFEQCPDAEESVPPAQDEAAGQEAPAPKPRRRAGENPSRATLYRWRKAAREGGADAAAVSPGVSLTPEAESHSAANETANETQKPSQLPVSRPAPNVINVSEELDCIAISPESGNVITLQPPNETRSETVNETPPNETLQPVPKIDTPALVAKLGRSKAEMLVPQRRPAVQIVVQMTGDTESHGNASRLWTISRYFSIPEAWDEAVASTKAAIAGKRIRTTPGAYFNQTVRDILNKKLEPLGFYVPIDGKSDASEAAAASASLRASWANEDAQTGVSHATAL